MGERGSQVFNYDELDKKDIESIGRRVAEKLKDHLPPGYQRLLRRLSKAIERAIGARHRRLVVLSGSNYVEMAALAARILLFYERVYKRIRGREELSLLYVFHDEFKDAKLRKEIVKRTIKSHANMLKLTIARYEESERYLGTTFNALVLDLVNDLKPNDVGRLTGIVGGGGIIVFMVPSWEDWGKWMTIFKRNLLVAGYEEPRHIFIDWFKRKLIEHKGIFVFDVDRGEVIKAEDHQPREVGKRSISLPPETKFPRELYELALTQDQVDVIHKLELLLDRGRRDAKKVVIITSDRGRGKSGAVGIASIGLVRGFKKLGRVRIAVTAPSLQSVQSYFSLVLKAASKLNVDVEVRKRGGRVIEVYGRSFSIEYWEPIAIPRLKADIVVVDEAAGIHVPLLLQIWRSHRRIVFATTIHGYEGAGRGFSVRFLPVVRSDKRTELIHVEMHEPIRYADDDPIERWLFDALLLNAEPAKLSEEDINDISEGRLEYVAYDPSYLFSKEGERELRELFGIYVLAHYRNEPDDLGILADAPHHIIRAVKTRTRGKVVCAIQIALEGGLDDDLIEDLLRGGKTPGNIIPDRLLKHARIRELGRMRGARIVRIATHPSVQGKGIGSFALASIVREAEEKGLEWVGSGFGVNEQLLNFWLKNGFLPLHMSPDRNPVSGEYTLLVMHPIAEHAKRIVTIVNREFKRKVLLSLHDPYRGLETEVALQILKSGEPIDETYYPQLTPIQVDRLWIYAYGPMTYEAIADVLYEIVKAYWTMYPKTRGLSLSRKEEYASIAKVLQGKSWEQVAEEMRMRPYTVMVMLKEMARKILRHYYGFTDETPIGLSLRELREAYASSLPFRMPLHFKAKTHGSKDEGLRREGED